MKTEKQVRDKLKEHEMWIEKELSECSKNEHRLINLRNGRIALQWVLQDEDEVKHDELTLKIDHALQL